MFALLRRKPSPHPCHAYHCPFCRQHHFGRVRGTTTPMKTLTLTLIIATLTSCASPRQPQTHADTKQRFDPVHGWNFGDSKHRPSHAKR